MHVQPFTIYQPSYPAGINWGHPLAQGLVAYVIGNHQVPVDLVSGKPGAASSPTTARARDFLDGRALDVSASLGVRYDFGYRPELALQGAVSGLFSGQFGSTGIQAIFGVHGGSGASLEGTPLLLYTSSAGTRPGFIRATTAGGFSWWNSGVAFTTGRPIRYAFSQPSGATNTPVFWQDGAFATTPANDGNTVTTPDFSTNSQLRLGNRMIGDRQFTGYFAVGALWARQLDRRDLQDIGAAPYQVLRHSRWPSRRAARNSTPSVVTGSLSVTESGDTLSADADVLVQVSLAATEPVETLSGAAASQVSATGALSDPVETLSGAASATVNSSLDVADPVESLSGAASTEVSGSATPTDPVETLTGVGAVGAPAVGDLTATDPAEVLSGAAAAAIAASFARTDPVETISTIAIMSGDLIHGAFTDPKETLLGHARVTGEGTRRPAVEILNQLLPPPRLTGDANKDLPSLSRWCNTLWDHLTGTHNVLGEMDALVRAVRAAQGNQTNVATEFVRVLSEVEQLRQTLAGIIQSQEE